MTSFGPNLGDQKENSLSIVHLLLQVIPMVMHKAIHLWWFSDWQQFLISTQLFYLKSSMTQCSFGAAAYMLSSFIKGLLYCIKLREVWRRERTMSVGRTWHAFHLSVFCGAFWCFFSLLASNITSPWDLMQVAEFLKCVKQFSIVRYSVALTSLKR